MNKVEQSKKAMLEALRKTLGNVSNACDIVGIGRTSHYNWLKADPEYKAAVDDIGEDAVDFVESKLFELISGVKCSKVVGDEVVVYETPPCKTSCIFYLKTKGKKRGYSEHEQTSTDEKDRASVTLPDGTTITI
jgi:hypothetical protein